MNMKALAVGTGIASLATGALAQATYDLSTGINNIPTSTWTMIDDNKVALFGVAGFFIGLGYVLRIMRKFGARTGL